MPRKIAEKKINDALTELEKVRKDWLKRDGVTAVDVGYKISEGEITNDLAIRVHVERKKHPDELRKHETFNLSGGAPEKTGGGFDIDVLEADYAPALPAVAEDDLPPLGPEVIGPESVNRKGRLNPLVGGVSVANARVSAGTLGAIVWDREDCQVCILSNWHVLCGSRDCEVGESILQPGKFDGGRPSDKVAELKRWRLDKDADAALANLTGARGSSRDILEWEPIKGVETPKLGMKVIKSGRTTGLTEGIIDGVGLSTRLNYGGGTVQSFRNQIHIVPRPPWPKEDYEVSKGGDSGSVWINEDTGMAVGLHFAGETDPSPTAEHAVANRMVDVARALNFSFTPLFCRTPTNGGDVGRPRRDNNRLRAILRAFLRLFRRRLGSGAQALSADAFGAGSSMEDEEMEALIDMLIEEINNS